MLEQYNTKAAPPGSLNWDGSNVKASLDALLAYVETEATKNEQWYWSRKKWKSRCSYSIQFLALTLTAAGALIPIVVALLPAATAPSPSSGLWSSLLVGVAAALLGLDKAFGFSSGWARYVLAATSIKKALEEFRMDWMALAAASSAPMTSDQVSALLQRAKDFRLAVEGIVLQETKDWVTEFQANLAQLEKDVKVQLDTLKAQVDKTAQAQAAVSQPGSIDATVTNADKTDGFAFKVILRGDKDTIAEDTVANSKKWVRVGVPPGQYTVTVTASIGGKPVLTASVVVVKPSEVTRLDALSV